MEDKPTPDHGNGIIKRSDIHGGVALPMMTGPDTSLLDALVTRFSIAFFPAKLSYALYQKKANAEEAAEAEEMKEAEQEAMKAAPPSNRHPECLY